MHDARGFQSRLRRTFAPAGERKPNSCSDLEPQALELVRLFDIRPGERVLQASDQGKGMEHALSRAVGAAGEVVSTDGAARQPRDSGSLPAGRETSFDQVVCCRLPAGDVRITLADWHRVLRLGGHLWIHLPEEQEAGADAPDVSKNSPPDTRFLINLASESGFELREISAEGAGTWIHTVKVRQHDPSTLYAL